MNNIYRRFIVVIVGVSAVLSYAYLQHKNIRNYFVENENYILKGAPENATYTSFEGGGALLKLDSLFSEGSNAVFVHFWATWCAPCEAELPAFFKFAKLFEKYPIKFLLLAVKDDRSKVRKFLGNIDSLPENIIMGFDDQGILMKSFGTLRVPETFLFGGQKDLLKKFIGPQDWSRPYFLNNSKYLLEMSY